MTKKDASKRVVGIALRMVRERPALLYPNRIIRSPKDAASLFRDFFGCDEADREQFAIMCLDTKHQPTALHVVSVGTLNATLVHPREVFKAAFLVNAAAILCAHSHPSGDPTPSAEDKEITQRLVDSGCLLGVDVLDHIILGAEQSFCSMKEQGLM